MLLFLTGAGILAAIIGLIWLKNRLQSPTLARLAQSELIARLAVLGAAFGAIGLLLMVVEIFGE